MFLDDENATGVTKDGAAAAPAKTAENSSAGGAGGLAPASSIEEGEESSVARQIITLTPEVTDAIRILVQSELGTEIGNELEKRMDQLATELHAFLESQLEKKIEAAKADILAHLTPLISAIVEGKTPPSVTVHYGKPPKQAAPDDQDAIAAAHELQAGDPVKVWTDREHKTFLEGVVAAVHDGGYAFDVELVDGAVSKIAADGLEYDDRR